MKKIILDTSFLIDIVKFKIDLEQIDEIVFQKYKLFTLSSVIKELEKISAKKGKDSENSRIALELIKSKKIEMLKSREETDKAIVKLSNKETIVATDDKELRKKLKNLGIKTIYLRARKRLSIS